VSLASSDGRHAWILGRCLEGLLALAEEMAKYHDSGKPATQFPPGFFHLRPLQGNGSFYLMDTVKPFPA